MKGHEFAQALKDPGAFGYGPPMLVMLDGECMCWKCAHEEAVRIRLAAMNRNKYRDGWAPAGFQIHWEGPPEICCNCNEEIPSEYGDPDAEVQS